MKHLPRLLVLVTGVYWLALFIVTHIPSSKLPTVPVGDKIEHLVGYALLGALLFLTLWANRPHWRQTGIIVLGVGMVYGAIDELLQAVPIVRRVCDPLDWMADTTGVALAVVCLTGIRALVDRRKTHFADKDRDEAAAVADR